MLIIDFNQTIISALMVQLKGDKNSEINENLVRHIILSNILYFKRKFSEYGEVILAADDKNYWRKSVFPYYKAHRKKWREDSEYDWNVIFNLLNKIRDELLDTFQYKVIKVESAEADDIIATLSVYASQRGEPVMIISADKDFLQLQRYDRVSQYSPFMKKLLVHSNPEEMLKRHILQGDRGDGIPNFLSTDDVFVSGKRQKGLFESKIQVWLKMEPEEFCDDIMLRNYRRNEQLIDLSKIPSELKFKILEKYNDYNFPDRSKLFPYFIENRLTLLMENINEF
jgi:hypothetical protein